MNCKAPASNPRYIQLVQFVAKGQNLFYFLFPYISPFTVLRFHGRIYTHILIMYKNLLLIHEFHLRFTPFFSSFFFFFSFYFRRLEFNDIFYISLLPPFQCLFIFPLMFNSSSYLRVKVNYDLVYYNVLSFSLGRPIVTLFLMRS